MSFKITATAPTTYQHNSLRAFGMDIKKHGNGSYSASMEFDTEEEAKAYLTKRADMYFESESELDSAYADIEHGCLTLDAVTARVEEVFDEE